MQMIDIDVQMQANNPPSDVPFAIEFAVSQYSGNLQNLLGWHFISFFT